MNFIRSAEILLKEHFNTKESNSLLPYKFCNASGEEIYNTGKLEIMNNFNSRRAWPGIIWNDNKEKNGNMELLMNLDL